MTTGSCPSRGDRAGTILTLLLAFSLGPATSYARSNPQKSLPQDSEPRIVINAANPSHQKFDIEFRANVSRLAAIAGVDNSRDLEATGNPVQNGRLDRGYLQMLQPYATYMRVGNTFFGYECMGVNLQSMAVRKPDGTIQHQFDETLRMLRTMLDSGFKPQLALTGQPRALISNQNNTIQHHAYGCTNAPDMDLSRKTPRDRVLFWDDMLDAFFAELIVTFGYEEVRTWSFATWTEPLNDKNSRSGHLVFDEATTRAGLEDDVVATLIAATIDVAMKYRLPIHIGNFAGKVQKRYPQIIKKILAFPAGREYLAYIDGYSVSRYKVGSRADIEKSLDDAFALLDDPAMPDKPLFIDELGYLRFDDGTEPLFRADPTRFNGLFYAKVFEKVFRRQAEGGIRSPKRVALWNTFLWPSSKRRTDMGSLYLNTPASNVVTMFNSMNGYQLLDSVVGSNPGVLAGKKGGAVKIIAFLDGQYEDQFTNRTQPYLFEVNGLSPDSGYRVTYFRIGAMHGNPLAIFLGGNRDYRRDSRFVLRAERWAFASEKIEREFFGDDPKNSWRTYADRFDDPLVSSIWLRSDASGKMSIPLGLATYDVVMMDVVPAVKSCAKGGGAQSMTLDLNGRLDSQEGQEYTLAEGISFDESDKMERKILRDMKNKALRFLPNGVLAYPCAPLHPFGSVLRFRFKYDGVELPKETLSLVSLGNGGTNRFFTELDATGLRVGWKFLGLRYEALVNKSGLRAGEWNEVEARSEKNGILDVVVNGFKLPPVILDLDKALPRSAWLNMPLVFGAGSQDTSSNWLLDEILIKGE